MRKNYILLFLAALLAPLGAKAQITEFPYNLDFENGMDGWTTIDADGDGYNWQLLNYTYDPGPHSGSYTLISRSYSGSALSPDNWFVSPAITLSSDPLQLSWYHMTQDVSYPAEHYAVYISTTGNTVADFTDDPVYEVTLTSADNPWVPVAVSLADYAGQTIYIAFRHFDCYDMFYFHIEDISISIAGAPMLTINGENSAFLGETATFSVSATGGDGSAVSYTWSSQMASAGQATMTGSTDSTMTITYTAEGVDTITVTGTNSSGTATASTAVTVVECNDVTEFPWTYDFQNEAQLLCWTIEDHDGNGSSWMITSYTSDPTGLFAYSPGSTGADNWMITPAIVLPADGSYSLDFDYVGYNYYYQPDLEVRISTTGNDDTTNFSTQLMHLTDYNSAFETKTISLADYAGETVHIAFVAHCGSSYDYVLIDNVVVRNADAPVVTLPGNANADANMAATFAAVITEGVMENITYTWTSTMEAAGLATMTATDSLLTITYTVGGEDTVTVTATNDHGSSTTTMYVHVRLCEVIDSLPWLETFANADATECWTLIDADGNGTTWYYNSGYLYGQYNSDGPDDWAITPAIAIPDDADGLVLSWDVWGSTYTIDNFYQVLASPTASMTIGDFTDTLFSESYPTSAWVTRTATIGQYAGQTVRFAFRHINTGDDDGMRIDNVGVRTSYEPVLSVSGPAGIQVGDTATFTATLNEGAADGLVFTFANQNATAVASTDSNVYTIVYTATGTDTITVIATNTFGADTVVLPISIFDLNPADVPYTCGFEPADQDTSWFIVNNSTNAWYIDTAVNNGGSYSLYISTDSGATYGYSISSSGIAHAYRAIRFSQAGQYAVSFDWQASGEPNYDFIRAYMAPIDATLPNSYSGITYGTLPAGFTAIDGGDRLNQGTGWQTATEVLSIDAPTTMLMVFSWRNDGSAGSQPPAAIDNVAINMLSCPQPTAIAVDSTGTDYIAFSWTPAGSETSWEVTVDSVSTVVTDTVFTAENLEANTEYSIRVRAICGEGDTSFVTSTTVRTECGALTLPYYESFEDGGESCWRFATTGTYADYHSIYAYEAAEGSNSLQLYMSTSGNKSYAILPELDNVNTLMITFQNYDYYDEQNQFEVGTMSSPTDISSFVPIYSTVGTDEWEEHEVRFAADTTGNRYIAFRATGTYNYTYVLIDDITVMVAPSCQRPESVSMSDIEADGATVTIADTTEVNNYQVIVVKTSTGDTVYNQLVNSNSVPVTGLEARTNYSVTAYAVCDDGNFTSAVNTTFRTACEDGNCEFTVAMADSYGDGWNGNAIAVWQYGENLDNLTIASGSYNTVNTSICLGEPAMLIWQSGNYPDEASFTISKDDSTILYIADGEALYTGDTLVVFDGQCGVSFVYGGGSTPVDTIPVPPQPVVCNAPSINAATATDNSVTVVWSGTANGYEVAIVEGSWTAPASGTAAAGPSYTFTGLQASTQYTVGVRSVCDDTVSAWATRSVTTAAAPVDTTDTTGIRTAELASFGLYPNPATNTVTVDLGSESAALVAIIDQSGRKSGEWRVESGKLVVNVSDMAKGAYFVRVTTAAGTSVRKLIVK